MVTGATKVASVRPGETVDRILAVEFYCLNSSEYDTFGDNLDPYSVDGQDAYGHNGTHRDQAVEHPAVELQKMLGNGSFYFSTDFDLTNRLQDRYVSSWIWAKALTYLGLRRQSSWRLIAWMSRFCGIRT